MDPGRPPATAAPRPPVRSCGYRASVHALPSLLALAAAIVLTPPILSHLRAGGFTRENYRGVALPFPAGIAIVAAGLASLGACAAVARIANADVLAEGLATVAVYALGIALLGLVDDLLAGPSRGWRGHGAAVLRGGFSTGALKAAGALALALWALRFEGSSAWRYMLAVALLVLTTNLFNLLDLRPGRAVKALALLGAGLTLGAWDARPLAAVGAFAAPALFLGLYDVRERAMLGDTGSNLIGGLAGLWMVLSLDTLGQGIALAIVAALTLYGELRSISAAIERIPLLRWIDSLGRIASHG
jgi:UDP-GlcNAc:undecaprenyl-phosphate/decaprenyl-phosphate GlcNAc-1-phosphate transferase